jgi:alcohol dehydrogenase (cytochrome c)
LPAAAAPPEDGQWTMPAKNFANTRYSGLDEIDVGDVGRLQVAFSFSTGVNRGQEGAPIVVDRTMYVVTPFPNLLYALDLTRPGAPMKWRYDPAADPAVQGIACCDTVNRGPTWAEGRIHFVTLDSHAVAVDAETGEELWKVRLGDINKGETMTMAPLVVGGKVIVGNSGGELGVGGWIQVLDAATGETLWKAYNIGSTRTS